MTDAEAWHIRQVIGDIKSMPSAQPERKTGRWIDAVLPNDNGGLPVQVCDQCNTFFPLAYTGGGHCFCPNCGAKMDGREERRMKVYELIQKLCENDPNHEVIIRVDGKCDRFMEYIEDSQNSAMEWSEIWATVDAVRAQKGIDKVFVDCDLSRL